MMRITKLTAALTLALASVGAAHAQTEAKSTLPDTPAEIMTQFCEPLSEKGFESAFYGLIAP